jgi:ferrous iron transport protein A
MALKQMEYAEPTDSTTSQAALPASLLAATSSATSGSPISIVATPTARSTKSLEIGLHQLAVGARARISSVSSCNHPICHKLLSMGIVEGQEVTLKGIAPLGDPIQIEALGYKLSLRKCEAAHVKVVPLGPDDSLFD